LVWSSILSPGTIYWRRVEARDERVWPEDIAMSNGSSLSLPELEDRIAILRDNVRQLIEQAAANSGAGDEARNSDRIAQQTEELDKLVKQRDELLKK
jgi:uncharacterized small protein (DUF1192 family)